MELQTKQPPELEFSMPEVEESLTAYLSAIGGAIIGLLLTLLVLAIWNGGTLNFTNISRVNALDAGLTDVAADLETVNANVDALGERLVLLEQESGAVAALQHSLSELDTSLADLDRTLSEQGIQLAQLDTAVEDLQVTRRNFDLFTAALTNALAQMETAAAASQSENGGVSQRTPSAGPAPSASRTDDRRAAESAESKSATTDSGLKADESAQPVQPLPQPAVVVSEKVAPDALLVYLFLDGNADGLFDADENLIAGATVTLTSPDGRAVAAENSVGSAGTLFEKLNGGEFTVSVDEVQGYTLASLNNTTVEVDPEAGAGQIVYFAVVTTAGD
ncbi:MAG: hypothetical protein F4047_16390 [Caldilineaceae bacterium SB0670_bin_27]|uniref:SD-repeat containing protein B domain-containing protein n=1 Tax=Caldilineaceae bacterium SB0664_bin_27 TaxID=2605260 RepID=A0A6B0YTN3_9CHLR|nr:hypothetical protein [Caldilineaceae bacterium SB0664_bin_27]MYJ79683.1 hypothetical protein [Caldilineaceae bacterium SB0670_bin_27]